MNTVNNQLRQSSDRRMREALLTFMEEGKEPSVGDICERAGVNRSTFYRHYIDIYDLMEKTEQEIQKELLQTMRQGGVFTQVTEIRAEALIPMIEYMGNYRHFYKNYLKTHLDVSMEDGMKVMWKTRLRSVFQASGVTNEVHMLYYYQYFRMGALSMLKLWLERDCEESPQEVAEMIINILKRTETPGRN